MNNQKDCTGNAHELAEQFHRIGKDGRKYYGLMAAGVLFTDGKSVLLLRRKAPSDHAGTWSLPGGRAKKGEPAVTTALREAREECGLERIPGARFAQLDDSDGRHRFTAYLFAVDQPFQCRLSKEHDDSKWVDLGDVEDYDLHPRMAAQLPRYRKAIARRFPPKKFSEWLLYRQSI